MTVYSINFGSYADLATPLIISPQRVVPIEPDQIIKANGIKVENGPFGWTLLWDEMSPAELDQIFDRTGSTSESSVRGYIRIWDRVPRSGSESWSIYTCILDQPTRPEYHQGPSRHNVSVAARNLVSYEELPP